MANRYWVGGAGTWNTSSTTHWSATSGGTGGASVPTSSDSAIFNASSGLGTVTLQSDVICKDLILDLFQNAINVNGKVITCQGTFSATGGSFSNTGEIKMQNAGTAMSIDVNSTSLGSNINVRVTNNGTLTIASSLTVSGTLIHESGTIVSGASWEANKYIGTAGALNITGVSVIVHQQWTMGNVALSSTGSALFMSNTGPIIFSGNGKTFGVVSFNAGGFNTNISGSNTYARLDLASSGGYVFEAGAVQTFDELTTVGGVTIDSSSPGNQFYWAKNVLGWVIFSASQITDCVVNALGGKGYFGADNTSIDGGNNLGWIFQKYVVCSIIVT